MPDSEIDCTAHADIGPARILRAGSPVPLVLLGDHASNWVPADLDGLGLAAPDLQGHEAWDIGAAAVTAHLSERLGACAVLATVSRLVVDLNRAPEDDTLIVEVSDRVRVPGNRSLDAAGRAHRLRTYHSPYHAAVAGAIARVTASAGAPPAIVAVHSFTPVMGGAARPWHVAILSNADRRLADPLLTGLAADPALVVGDNEPYSGTVANYTLDRHAGAAGLLHAAVEIRQDLIAAAAGQAAWATRLAELLQPWARPQGNRLKFHEGCRRAASR